MILFIQKCFSLPMRFFLCIPARQVAGFVLTLLLVISLMTAAQAEEESEIVTDARVSLEQMAQSAESEMQTHRAELADLNEHRADNRLAGLQQRLATAHIIDPTFALLPPRLIALKI